MDNYVTGTVIRALRKNKGMTQSQLAEKIGVSDKAVSRWESGNGLPDISLIGPLAAALDISVNELMNGSPVTNGNRSGNMLRSCFYVCPVCGNVIHALGTAAISCCGVTLPPLEPEEPDEAHALSVEPVEDELYVTLDHEMTKSHYISFISSVTGDRVETVKLYPEGNAETRIHLRGTGYIYWYCNRHGLFRVRARK